MSKEKKCNNCRLFDPRNKRCQVVIIHEGQRVHLPVNKRDTCFFEDQFTAVKEELVGNEVITTKETFIPAEQIKEVKWWVEDPKTGEKSDKGIVKVEYDNSFFGDGHPDIVGNDSTSDD